LVDGGNGNQNSTVCSMPRLPKNRETYEVGNRIKNVRIRQNISQGILAPMIGVSYQQLQKYERGINNISVPTMKKIAAALGVRPCEICGCCDE